MSEERRTILVTGGSRGIGAETARMAAERGYDVCLSFRSREAEASRVRKAVEERGRRALAIAADFGDSAAITELWRRAIEHFGRIDVLVNNVGILERQMRLEDFEPERLERVFRVNITGAFICAREAVRHMSTRHGGSGGAIINVSSMAARLGSPNEYVDYAASKGALDTMTIGLAKEVAGEGIRVNGIRPGSTYTEIHADGGEPNRVDRIAKVVPLRRGGQPADMAGAILWLASEEASYVTGAILDVAGGL